MKRLRDLKPADIERVAVWRYTGSSDDDATVSATDKSALIDEKSEDYIARTQFVLANGSQHTGFCSPRRDTSLDYLQPVILTSFGPVYFWFPEPPSEESLKMQWQRLGATHEQIFPVHFRCAVPMDGYYVTGTIEEDDLTGAA